jgi:peroxiredoxin
MARTPSTMLPLGTPAPAFSLPDFAGRVHALTDFRDQRALLVAFICNHCPFVRHIRAGFASYARDYRPQRLAVVAINSNDLAAYPQDGPDGMRAEAAEAGYDFPYLLDETQVVAQAYRAACTPDFYLFDAGRRLVYRGQFDDSRDGRGAGRAHPRRAADAEHRLQHQVEAGQRARLRQLKAGLAPSLLVSQRRRGRGFRARSAAPCWKPARSRLRSSQHGFPR